MTDATDPVREAAMALAASDPAAALTLCEAALADLLTSAPARATLGALASTARAMLEAQERSRHTQEHLDMFSRASFEGLLMHVDGVVVAANARFEEIVGFDRGEVLGLNALQIMVAPESQPEVLRRMQGGIEGAYVITGVRKDGTRFPAELHSKQGHLGERPVRVVGVRDVTERERTQKNLRESEERLRRLLRHTFDVTTVSADGVVIDVEGDLEGIFGLGPEAIIGRSVVDFVTPSVRDKVESIFREQREGPYEAEILHADGTVVPLRVVSTRATLDGQVVRIAGLKDERASRQAELDKQSLERKVERAQRLESLGVLAGGIAHDFNNLLVGILGNADLMRTHVSDPALLAYLDGIVAASNRAAELTSQMLAYAGRGGMEGRRPVVFEGLVEELGSLLQVSTNKKTRVTFDLAPERSVIVGEKGALGQVVLNLLTNASEALEGEVGTVLVRTLRMSDPGPEWEAEFGPAGMSGDFVMLEVTDTGSGMTDDVAERIFEPFFTTKPEGHGLGLAACLGIVRNHGGAIRMETQLGGGTSFFVLLPRSDAPADATSNRRDPTDGSLPGPYSVLVVDDEKAIRTFVRAALEYADFAVDEAFDGEHALERMSQRDYDLILLDLSMPKLDGAEVVRRLRAAGDRTPVILTSGYADVGMEQRLEGGSYEGFLRKPYRVKALYEAIRAVVPASLETDRS